MQHGFIDQEQRHSKLLGMTDNTGLWIIGHNGADADRRVVFKVF